MIALLKGKIEFRSDPNLIIDVNGVGYKVHAAHGVLINSAVGDIVKLYIYSHIREDLFELYGFSEFEDLRLFEQLISVSGIGPKTAINIYTIGNRSEIVKAIINSNVEFFSSVPRLGKKNAQKIIIELKSKIGKAQDTSLDLSAVADSDEVVAALKNFGFTSGEALSALRSFNSDGLSTGEKVRMALKHLGR